MGKQLVISLANPAAGADWSATVPPGVVWDVLALTSQLATSPTAGQRYALLVLGDGASTFLQIPNVGNWGASNTARVNYARNHDSLHDSATPDHAIAPLPSLRLMPGWTIGSLTTGLDAGDQWSHVVLLVLVTQLDDDATDLAVGLWEPEP